MLHHTARAIAKTLFVMALLSPMELQAEPAPPFNLPQAAELNRIRSAEIQTSKGTIYLELYPEDAPWHVANFKYLADKKFYDNSSFHIYFPGYILQGGAIPSGKKAEPAYTLDAEFNRHRHEAGALGMARRPDSANPERRSDGHQFHIIIASSPHMNGSYTVFGKVVQGMDVVEELRKDDKIISVKVFVRD